MPTFEEFIAAISVENKELKTGIVQAVDSIRSFEKTSQESFEKFATYAEQNFKKFSDSVESLSLQNIQDKLDNLATAGKEALSTFIGSAAKVEQFRLTLETLTGSAEDAEKELQRLVAFSAATPFQLEDVVAAGVTLRSFRADVERFLPLAGDLASVFGRNIKDSARALGKSLSGSQDGIQILNDSFGIARRDLKEAGATMKSTGAIALDTSEDIAKLADAIQKVAKEKNFTGNIEKQLQSITGNVSQLQDASFQLAAAVGDSLSGTFIALVQPATNLVSTLTKAPPILLGMGAGLVALSTGAAIAGSAVISLGVAVAALKPFFISAQQEAIKAYASFKLAAAGSTEASTSMRAAAVAAKGFGLALGASVFAAGALFALNQYEQSALRTAKAIDEAGDAVTATFHGFRTFRNAVADATNQSRDFIDAGDSTVDVLRAVEAALDGIGSFDLVESLARSGIELKSLDGQFAATNKRTERFKKELEGAYEELARLQKLGGPSLATSAGGQSANRASQEEIDAQLQIIKNLETIIQANEANARIQKSVINDTKDAAEAYDRINRIASGQLRELEIKADTDSLERSNQVLAETDRRIEFIKDSFASLGKEFKSVEAIQDALALADSDEARKSLTSLLELYKERDKLQKQSVKLENEASRARVDAILLELDGIESAEKRLKILTTAANTEKFSAVQRKRVLKEISKIEREINTEEDRATKAKINQAIYEAQAVAGGAEKKIAALRKVLAAYQAEGDQRRQILRAIDRAERELAAERKKRLEDEAKGYQDEVFRQQELLIGQIDQRIEKLRQEAEQGKNVNELIVAALKERGELEIELIEARTEARKKEAKSTQVQAEIEKTGQLEIEEARRKVEDAVKDQRKAQQGRIQDIKDERDAALGAVRDEKEAREDLANSDFSQRQRDQSDPNSNEPLVKGAPGQSLEQVAGFLSRFDPRNSTGPQTGQGIPDAEERRQRFRDLNPGVLERGEAQDAEVQQRIAEQARAQQEELAAKSREKLDQIAEESRKTREAQLANQRVQQAQFEVEQFTKGSPEFQAAQEKLRQTMEDFQKVQQSSQLPLEKPENLNERIQRVSEEREAKAKAEEAKQQTKDTNVHIVVEIDDKGQNVIKSVRSKGIDGRQTSFERDLNRYNLKTIV